MDITELQDQLDRMAVYCKHVLNYETARVRITFVGEEQVTISAHGTDPFVKDDTYDWDKDQTLIAIRFIPMQDFDPDKVLTEMWSVIQSLPKVEERELAELAQKLGNEIEGLDKFSCEAALIFGERMRKIRKELLDTCITYQQENTDG